MAIALVQDAGYNANPAANSLTINITSTGGNTLTVAGDLYSPSDPSLALSGITDTAGNTWHLSTSNANFPPYAFNSSGSNYFVSFVAYCIGASAVTSVTLHFSTISLGGATIDVSEWSGVTAADTGAAGEGTATATSPGTITLAQAGELVIGATDYLGSVSSNPSGATQLSATTGIAVAGYKIFAGSGSQSFQWGFTGSTVHTVALLALKGAATLQVTTSSLAEAELGQPYSDTLQAANGTPPYTWSIASGSLPSWASLNTSTGAITGTAPGAATGLGSSAFTVRVTDNVAATATKSLTLGGAQPFGAPVAGPWNLVFNEGFDTAHPGYLSQGAPDPAVWADHIIYGDSWRNQLGTPGDAEWSPHNKAGLSVAGSVLTITTRHEDPTNPASVGYDPAAPSVNHQGTAIAYTTGIINSRPGFSATFGYWEARVQIPNPSAAGSYHPAFYLDDPNGVWNGGPEVDVMEWQLGSNSCGYWYGGGTDGIPLGSDGADGNYHTYSVHWTPSEMTFFFDGVQTLSYTGSPVAVTVRPMFVYLNVQVNNPGSLTGYPTSFNVDYVRVWNLTGVPAQPAVTSISPASGVAPGSGNLTVSFGAVSGATSYRASACPVDPAADGYPQGWNGTPPYTVGEASGASSPLTITGLTPGMRYYASVTAINATGYSIESAPVPSLAPQAAGSSALLLADFP